MFNKYYKKMKKRIVPFILIMTMLMQTGMGNVVWASDAKDEKTQGQTESMADPDGEEALPDQSEAAGSREPGEEPDLEQPFKEPVLTEQGKEPDGQPREELPAEPESKEAQEQVSESGQSQAEGGSADPERRDPIDWTQRKDVFQLSPDKIVYQDNDGQSFTVKSIESRLDLSMLTADAISSQQLVVRFAFDQAGMTEQLKAGDTFSFYVPREYMTLTDTGEPWAATVCSRQSYEAEPSEIRDTENFGTYTVRDNVVTFTVTGIPASGNLFGVAVLPFQWKQEKLTSEGTDCELTFQEGAKTLVQLPKKAEEDKEEQTKADQSKNEPENGDKEQNGNKNPDKSGTIQSEGLKKEESKKEEAKKDDTGKEETLGSADAKGKQDSGEKESAEKDDNIFKRFYRSIVSFFTSEGESTEQNYAGGHSFGYTFHQAELPEGFYQVKVTVNNKNGGYQTADDLRVGFKFVMSLDEDFLYSVLENEIRNRTDYPVQGNMSDSEYEEKMTAYLNQLEENGELTVLEYRYDLGGDFREYSKSDPIDLVDAAGTHCGEVTVKEGIVIFHFDGSCYYYDDIAASISMEAKLNDNAVSDDPIDVAFGDHGELMHQSAGKIDDETGNTEDQNYQIEKEAPIRVANSEITYTVKVSALNKDKTLNSLLVTDTLPDGMELKKVTYGGKELTAPDGYTYDAATRTFTYRFEALKADKSNAVTEAEFTLTAKLNDDKYGKVIQAGGIDEDFKNKAELREKDKPEPLKVSDEVTTNMKFTFLSKQGQEEQLNGTRYLWTITANTQLPYLEYGYLLDTLCWTDHQYDFDRGITVHTQNKDTVYKSGDITAAAGGPAWEDLTAEGLKEFIEDKGITGPFYYLYDTKDQNPFYVSEADTPDEPEFKQMAVLVLPFDSLDGWTGREKQQALKVKYFTGLNLHGLSVDEYLLRVQADENLNPEITNRAALLWHNKGGVGPGPALPENITWDKTGTSNVKAMTKKAVSYNEKTQELRWRLDVNRYGASLKNVMIEDELLNEYDLNADSDLTINIRKYNQTTLTEESGSPAVLKKVKSESDLFPGTYMISENAGRKTVKISLGDLVSWENGMATHYYCVLDFQLKLKDPQYLAEQTDGKEIKNGARIQAVLNEKPFEDTAQGTIQIPNRLIDKTAVGSYNYKTHKLKWQIKINPNRLPIKDAKITDTLPVGIQWSELTDIKKDGQSLAKDQWAAVISDPKTALPSTALGEKTTIQFKNPIEETYTFTFESEVTDEWIKDNLIGADGKARDGSVINTVQLDGEIYGQSISNAMDTAEHKVSHMNVGKSGVYHKDEGTITWTVLMNVDKADISGMHLVEDMTANSQTSGRPDIHELDMDSIKVEKVSLDDAGNVAEDPQAQTVSDPDLRTIDPGAQKGDLPDVRGFAFYIPEGAADHSTYRITFTTELLAGAPTGKLIENKVYLKNKNDGVYDESDTSDGGYGGDFDADHMVTKSTRPKITMTKASGNSVDLNVPDAKLLLQDADFQLTAYTFDADTVGKSIKLKAETGRYNKIRTTKEDGDALFLNIKAKSSTDEPLIYKLEERKAPSGYKVTEPVYIIYSDGTIDYSGFTKIQETAGQEEELSLDSNYFVRKAASSDSKETTAALTLKDEPLDSSFTFGKKTADGITYDNTGKAAYTYGGIPAAGSVVFKITPAGNLEDKVKTQYVANDASGNFTIQNLDPGNYKLTEAASPENFSIEAEYQLTVTINDSGDYEYEIKGNPDHNTELGTESGSGKQEIRNGYLLGSFSFRKQIQYEDSPKKGTNPNSNAEDLSGVAFQLKSTKIAGKENDTFVKTVTSGADGKVEFTDVPVGEYTLTEGTLNNGNFEAKVTGYIKRDAVKVIVKETEDKETILGTDNKTTYYGKKAVAEYQKMDFAADIPDFIQNDVYSNTAVEGTISFTKLTDAKAVGLDAFNSSTSVLPGAQFGLYRKIGTETAEAPTYTAVSGNDGAVRFENVEYGDYVLKETDTPSGYKTIEPIEIKRTDLNVSSDNKSFSYTVTGADAQQGEVKNSLNAYSVKFSKKDQDGNPLAGKEFFIYRRNSQAIQMDGAGLEVDAGTADKYYQYQPLTKTSQTDAITTPATDENGILKLEKLPYGDYLLVENTLGGNLQDNYGKPAIHISITDDASEAVSVNMTQNFDGELQKDHYDGFTPIMAGRWTQVKAETDGSYPIVNNLQHFFIQVQKVAGNENTAGKLEAEETGQGMKKALEGARFEIYEGSEVKGTPYLTLETNSKGQFEADAEGAYQDARDPGVSKHLWVGQDYTIRETAAPEGFDIVSGTGLAAAVKGTKASQGDTFYVWREKNSTDADLVVADKEERNKDKLFVNAYSRGNITLTKVDAKDESITIEGAEFLLKETEGKNQGKAAAILKDSGDGRYTLAPVPDTISDRIEVKEMKGGIEANYLYNAGTEEKPDYRILTGKYDIEETTVPEGYEKAQKICEGDTDSIEIGVSKSRDVRITLKETPVSLEIRKRAADTKVDLNGAKFTVRGKFKDDKNQTDAVKTLEQANLERAFLAGEIYTLHEKNAPAGFLAGTDVEIRFNEKGEVQIISPPENCPARLDPDDNEKQTLIYEDEPLEIKLRKVDESDHPLEGAVFELEGTFVRDGVLETTPGKLTVTSTGEDISFTESLNKMLNTTGMNLAQGQIYTLTETKAPQGYIREKSSVRFIVNQDGTISEADQSAWEAAGYRIVKEKDQAVVVQLKDEPIVFSLKKTAESGEAQEGVEFTITPKNGSSFMDADKNVLTLTTGADGTAKLSNQLKHGNRYTIHEEKALAGYCYAEDFEIAVDEDGVVKVGDTVVTADQPYPVVDQALTIRIVKKDDAGQKIQGIGFTLTKDMSSLGQSWSLRSNADGVLEVIDSKGSKTAELASVLEAGQSYLLTEKTEHASPYVALKAPVKIHLSRDGRIVKERLDTENTELAGRLTLDETGQTLEIRNDRTSLSIKKVDVSGQLLPGAELGIYSDDQGEAGKLVELNKVKLKWISEADKTYTLRGLPTGIYWIKETKTPTGYVTAEPIQFELKSDDTIQIMNNQGTVNKNTITMTDDAVVGAFTLVKNQAGTNIAVKDAVFALYQQTGEAVSQADVLLAEGITTGADGTWSSKDSMIRRKDDATRMMKDGLGYGRYYLKEMSTPDEYQLDTAPIPFTIEGKADGDVISQPDIKTVKAENEVYLRELKVQKQDQEDQRALSGAVFSLTRIKDGKGNEVNEPAWEAATDTEGTAAFTITRKGTYRLAEIKAPNGYMDASGEKPVYVKEFTVDDQTEASVMLEADTTKNVVANERKTGTLTMTKQDGLDEEKLDDVGFTLFRKDEENNFQKEGEFFTGKNYSRTASVEWNEQPGETGELNISGLLWGEYYIEETSPLDGYVTNDTKYEFTIGRYESEIVLRVDQGVITNTQTKIRFSKVGIYNESCSDPVIGAPSPDAAQIMEGVTFTAYTDPEALEDSKVAEAVSDTNGEVIFKKLPVGTYYIRETLLPKEAVEAHYKLDEKIYMAILDKNGQFAGLKLSDGSEAENNTVVNDVERTDIVIEKVDEKNPDRKLPGSTYGLFKRVSDVKGMLGAARAEGIQDEETQAEESGKEEWIQIAQAVTDEKGILRFAGVLMDTEYQVRELIAPDGSYVSGKPLTIRFKMENGDAVIQSYDDGEGTTEVDPKTGKIVWREPQVEVEFSKKDEQGSLLEGASLEVQDREGNVIESWTSRADQPYTSYGKLVSGETYRLIETEAPKGYEIAKPVEFTIPAEAVGPNENKVIQVEMIDKKIPKKEEPDRKPGADEKKDKPDTPVKKLVNKVKTGDYANIWGYILMLLMAAVVITAAAVYKKKRK